MHEAGWGYRAASGGRSDLSLLKRRLEEIFRRGDLVIARIPQAPLAAVAGSRQKESEWEKAEQVRIEREKARQEARKAAADEKKKAGAPPSEPAPQRTYIEIVLRDETGRPIPSERYRIKLPDGTTQEGRLDAEGRARHDNLDPGACEICFPDLDASTWWAA